MSPCLVGGFRHFSKDLTSNIEECMHLPRPITFRLAQMFDISTWMKTCRETLHDLVHPHCFKFTKKDSKVVMYYRKWSCDNCMGPVTILKDEKPGGVPPSVASTFLKQDVEGLKKDIPKFFGHMPSRRQEFWEKILQNPENLMQRGSSEQWPLTNVKIGPQCVLGILCVVLFISQHKSELQQVRR